jgi:hypothetical protein
MALLRHTACFLLRRMVIKKKTLSKAEEAWMILTFSHRDDESNSVLL